MNFKAYDILVSLLPGFLVLTVVFWAFKIPYESDLIVPYTASAFLVGFIINTLSSWAEGFYFFTWGGKPSNCLLKGKDIWKVNFYQNKEVKTRLKLEAKNELANEDELFNIAMRYSNGQSNRVDDFNAIYGFSRSLLTTVIICSAIILYNHHEDYRYYLILSTLILITWLRCKQRAYYYSREVLNYYLKNNNK